MIERGTCVIAGVGLVSRAGVVVAQRPAWIRTLITRADVSVTGREAVMARIEIAPGGDAGWHTHPGDAIS